MGTYRPLYNIRIEHEYFDGNICRAMQCRISPSGQALCHRRGLLFRQTGTNEWTILYDDAGAGVDTLSDVLALELVMADPAFVLYTQWNGFQPSSAYRLELPVGQETLEEVFSSAKAGTPETACLQFHVPEYRWEYLFVSRGGEKFSPEKLRLEECGGKLTFGPFEAAAEYGREVLRTVSLERIPLRKQYGFRLRLTSVTEGDNRPRQVLLRNVALPKPGVFLSKAPELLRQLCYF